MSSASPRKTSFGPISNIDAMVKLQTETSLTFHMPSWEALSPDLSHFSFLRHGAGGL